MLETSNLKDHLTQTYSRAAFDDYFCKELKRSRRYSQPLALALLDLDHFKSINDAFGHSRGDEVLVELALRLNMTIRASDFAFRVGGDEFALLLPSTTREEAYTVAERVLSHIQSSSFPGTPPLKVSISVGVACYPEDGVAVTSLMEVADQRHYAAKRAGRGRVVASDDIEHDLLSRLPLEPPSRLLEQEHALQAAVRFLQAAQTQHQAALLITGPKGAGQTRLLAETAHYADLQGYLTLILQASPAMKQRAYAALNRALETIPGLISPSHGEELFLASLKQMLFEKSSRGLCLLIDQASDLDHFTQSFLQQLIQDTSLPPLALVYATHTRHESFELPLPGELVELQPLSPNAVQIWLRHSLQQEPDPSLVEWVHRVSGGLPARIVQALKLLLEEKVLLPSTRGFVCTSNFEHLSLKLENPQTSALTQLLQELPVLVGRDQQLRQVLEILRQNRLVSLVGPGGTGKSRLALQIGAEYRQEETFFVALAGTSSYSGFLGAIANSLGLQLGGSHEPRNQILNHLEGRNSLLILDNFEQLLLVTAATSFISQLLERAPGVKLLITSREILELPEEMVIPLAGLDYPTSVTDPAFEAYGANRLFVQKARSLEQTYNLEATERNHLLRICRQVEGWPLGLLLAASWVQDFSLENIASRLEGKLVEAGEQSELSVPPGSLNSVFESFWQLLSRSEQETLQNLAVFKGGFTRQAARQIAYASPFFLRGLVNKTFLRVSQHGRYEMHELLRQFLAEKLAQHPNLHKATLCRHSRYYLELLCDRGPQLYRGEAGALQEVLAEVDNLRQAWREAVREADCELIFNSIWGFTPLYLFRSLPEGMQDIELALERLRGLLATSAEADWLVQKTLAGVLAYAGGFLNEMARFKESIEGCQEALALVEASPVPSVVCSAHFRWGRALLWQQQYEEAISHFETGIALAEGWLAERGHDSILIRIQADCLRSIGICHYSQKNYEPAVKYTEAALKLNQQDQDRMNECCALANLGEINLEKGDYAQAKYYCEAANEILKDLPYILVASQVNANLGQIYLQLGDYGAARVCFETALENYRYMGSVRFKAQGYCHLGLVCYLQGQAEASLTYSQEALAMAREIKKPEYEAYALLHLGQALTRLERFEEAGACYREGLALPEQPDNSNQRDGMLAGLARLAMAQGDLAQAQSYIAQILSQTAMVNSNKYQPLMVYQTCYEVLTAGKDRRAIKIIEKLQAELDQKARHISDHQMREQYIKNQLALRVS
jgi:diguanylate cyclase (GGDEF)-like protein